jgi:hypothetical protein
METQESHDGPGDRGKLPVYLSPYEYWNFGRGRGYAFPIMQKHSTYISAFAELVPSSTPNSLGATPQLGHLPTLWKKYNSRKFLPFVAENPTQGPIVDIEQLTLVLLGGLGQVVDMFAVTQQLPQMLQTKFADIKTGRFRVALPVPDLAMHAKMDQPSDPEPQPDPGLRRRTEGRRITIMAVIDDGIPFAHRNFRDASGCRTRIEFCWLQSVAVDPEQNSVLFGREYAREKIDRYIELFGDDEDRLYREAGATTDADGFGSVLERHATHGAHVMDLATGYDPARGEHPPEEIRIIAVQLPNSVTMDTSGFGKDMYLLSALHYIFHRADMIADMYGAPNPRLVINFSYGYTGGRHDGETELEAAINELVEMRRVYAPTALVLPAGNSFLERLHGEISDSDFKQGAAQFAWRLQPNDRTSSYLELWFCPGFEPSGYSIELRDPRGRPRFSSTIGANPAGFGGDPIKVCDLPNDNGAPIGQVSVDLHRADATETTHQTGRWRVLVVMAPTEPENALLPGADSGKWTVVIRRDASSKPLDGRIHCWVQRATDFEAFRSGSRQSYLDDLSDVRYSPEGDLAEVDTNDAFVKRFGTLSGLATGRASLVAAGYRLGAGLGSSLKEARPARYSSAGTLEPGWPEAKVACSSISDRSRVLPGTVAAGVRSGALSLVQGTSVAAPFVARRLATVFVTADDERVKDAERENYLSLLPDSCEPSGHAETASGNEDLTAARLGAVRVAPHRQPGIECDHDASTR